MRLSKTLRDRCASFDGLTLYERFEHAIVLVLTFLIVVVVASATWHLALTIVALLLRDALHPANPAVFQIIFG